MTTKRREAWSWMNDVMPFIAMLMITCMDMSVLTIVKAAMNDGMSTIVYIVYHDALGMFILLPFFIISIFRNVDRPPLSFHLLFRFFILGLLGLCLYQVLAFEGIYYSSPTMASAISNLTPAYTFLIAVAFRMEKIDITSSSSLAKLTGTIIAISGAMLFTFYQGPEIFHTVPSPDSSNQLLLSQPSGWIFGGLILVFGGIVGAIWNVLQTATAREYPDQRTIVFFFCLFGTIQCIALSPFLEPNPNAWVLQPGTGMIAVVWGAVFSVVFRNIAITWCLEKKGPVFVAMFSPLSIVIAVIMGVTFLGDSLHLGSAIGATIVAAGFYTVMWGQTKERNKLPMVIGGDLDASDDQTAPLLSSGNGSLSQPQFPNPPDSVILFILALKSSSRLRISPNYRISQSQFQNPNFNFKTMSEGYAIELYFDPALENQVLKAWNVVARRQISTHLIEIESRPHITLFSSPFIDPSKLENIVKTFASKQDPLPLSFGSIGSLPSDNNVLFLAPTPTLPLLQFHFQLCDAMKREGVEIGEEYRPDSWIPYCPVAEEVPKNRMAEAFTVLRDLKLPVTGYAMDIGLVEYSPVRELFSFVLGSAAVES
ncbi:hypothetical protein L1987_05464 [Smallanthus sonchifolius]|uniref:Uncharacterized protein n=1 Tax=Smallanthus sonchifolius TaxID=185202 RepID=A0ACB9JVI2_9ASTR|nr:hypothetical protein L1987_05464 [Smallanthus sonchifolius]